LYLLLISTSLILIQPTLAQSSSATSLSASDFFVDSFDGASIDASKWNIQENTNMSGYLASGGSVTVSDGNIALTSDGSSFPYVTSRVNPFPESNNFVLEFNFTYTRIMGWGTGLMVTKGPYDSSDGSNIVFAIWTDSSNINGIAFDLTGANRYTIGGNYNPHIIRLRKLHVIS
jgi:hypothetical protein